MVLNLNDISYCVSMSPIIVKHIWVLLGEIACVSKYSKSYLLALEAQETETVWEFSLDPLGECHHNFGLWF